jgi:predicted transposase/invertase (TIGR01784 family)
MARYLDPKNDFAFKRVFGEHRHLCMSLINAMLPLAKPIVGLEYQSGEVLSAIPALRNSIVDVRCTDEDGRQFIVEMQMFWSEMFKARVLFNASKVYVNQFRPGDNFKLVQPVYALNFVNDTFEKSPERKDEYYHYYKIVNVKDTNRQIEGLEFLFVELPKFKPQGRAEKKLQELWLRFLTEINENTEEASRELLENELTHEAVDYMELAAFTKEQMEAYDNAKIGAMTEKAIMDDALEKGEAKGRAEGEAKGRAERNTEIARNLLAKGMSASDVSDVTGLPEQQIEDLIRQ